LLLAVIGGGYFALHLASPPSIDSATPNRAKIGQTVVLSGRGFDPNPQGDTVLFGERRANVLAATSSRLEVVVPVFPLLAGRDAQTQVTVQTGGRTSAPVPVALYAAPRIDGLSKDVAMPGEEIDLAGGGWNSNAGVRFGTVPGEIVSNTPSVLKVRVPPLEGAEGTRFEVVVTSDQETSNAAPFFVGKLPLVKGVQPSSAAPGDTVTVSGRGFKLKAHANVVRVGGVRALVTSASDSDLKFVVPWTSASGDTQVEVRELGAEGVGTTTLGITPPSSDTVDFHFTAEPLPVDDVPDHDHAVVATELGPLFVLSASGGRSAAERAVEAARLLNAAAGPLKASLEADLAVQGTRITLAGKPDALVEATAEDAQAYAEEWTKSPKGARAPTPGRLALWWGACTRDLVLLLVRGDHPQHTVSLAPEGRGLDEIYQAAKKTGRFGVPRSVLTGKLQDQMRTLAFHLPAAVPEVGGGAAAGAGTSGQAPALQLQGVWRGNEIVGGEQNYLTVTFKGNEGTARYGAIAAISMDLQDLQATKDTLRFALGIRGGRHYSGTWDGRKVSGQVFSDPTLKSPIGTFELIPGQ
jgi:hypothetical protein